MVSKFWSQIDKRTHNFCPTGNRKTIVKEMVWEVEMILESKKVAIVKNKVGKSEERVSTNDYSASIVVKFRLLCHLF